jgi:hypothetical protein
MKLSLIREATIDQVQKRIPIWTQKHFNNDQQKSLELLPSIITADPTKGKYSEWLVKQWKDGTARFPEDTEKLAKNLELFHQKKSKLQEKDIGRYTPDTLAKALDQELGLTKSERKKARKGELQLPPGAEVVLEKDKYTAVKITTPEASSTLCSGTEWCVANKNTAEDYLKKGPLYLIYVDKQFEDPDNWELNDDGQFERIDWVIGGTTIQYAKELERKYLVHIEMDQFMDVYDSPVSNKIKSELIDLLEPVTGKTIYNYAKFAYHHATELWHDGDVGTFKMLRRFPEGEAAIATDPEIAYRYALYVIKGRFPEGEAAIAKASSWATHYAKDVIKGRWPEGEAAIAKDPFFAYKYAKDVIKGRFPEGEAAIATDPGYAYYYAKEVIKGRWPEGEAAITTDPGIAYRYAKEVIKGRFPEGEAAIAKDASIAFDYAKDIIKGRFPEGEAAIALDPLWAYKYAKEVIKGRFPEAEATIAKSPLYAKQYREISWSQALRNVSHLNGVKRDQQAVIEFETALARLGL